MPLHSGKSPDRVKGGPRITGRGFRRQRAAGTVSLRATGAQEGALRPLLRITPRRGCSRMPATANKFVHILWKNLLCDNIAAVSFFA